MSRSGVIFVLLSGIGFGFIGIFSRWALQTGLSVGEILAWRFLLAASILWIALLLFRPKLILLPYRQILISFALGIGGYAVFSTFYFKAIESLSVPLAAILLFTFPLFVNIGGSIFLKEHLEKKQVLSLIVAFCGLFVLLWGPLVVTNPWGVFFGLGSAVSYSIYVLVSRKVQQNVPAISSSLYVITAAGLTQFFIHMPQFDRLMGMPSLTHLSLIGLAIVCTIGPLTFFLLALQRLPSGLASLLVMIEPVVATLAAGIILGETLSAKELIGATIVLAGLGINFVKKVSPTGFASRALGIKRG